MLDKRIDWQPGLLLSSKVFSQQDQWHQQAYNTKHILPSPQQGIIDIDIDEDSLLSGIIVIKSLHFIDAQKIIHNYNDINLRLDLNHLEEQLEQSDIYINFYESSEQSNSLTCITTKARLGINIDNGCINSFYLGKLIILENKWCWSDYIVPMYYVNNPLGFNLLKRIENYLIKIQTEYLIELDPNKAMLLSQLIIGLQFQLRRASKKQISLATYSVFEQFVKIICACYVKDLNNFIESFDYNMQNLNKSFNRLFEALDNILNKPSIITQIPLIKQNNYFITKSLNKDLFRNKKWYLKVLANNSLDIQNWHPQWIRICAPSRHKLIENMALNGLHIEPIKTDIHQVLIKEQDKSKLYKLSYGLEWDHIINDQRLVCLINDEQAFKYRYVLYYQD